MVWNSETIDQLKAQWSQGMSITQIGKNLGTTRNAVVGKAHRLGLEKRDSPIVRSATPKPAVQAPVVQPERQPLVAHNGPRCKWPVGDPKSSNFRFCTGPALDGYPYCREHCAAAYSGWAAEEKRSA